MLWNLFPLNCCKENKSEHVRIMCDKVTAIAYINQKSWLESSKCNNIAREIYLTCLLKLTCKCSMSSKVIKCRDR